MPRTKKTRRAENLRAYQEQQRTNQAAQLSTNQETPILPTSPTPPTPSTPSTPSKSLDIPFPEDPVSLANVTTKTTPPPNTPFISNHRPPPLEIVRHAIPLLEARVNPKRKSGIGHKTSKLSPLALKDLTSVLELFRSYVTEEMTWRQASVSVSKAKGLGMGHAETLRAWGRACLLDPLFIPRTSYGHSQHSLISYDEFQAELLEYLCGVGRYITAVSVIQFTAQPDTQSAWGLTKPISKTTAQKWMKVLGYRWRRQPKGLYLDGHERPDVVEFRQKVFLREWNAMEPRMQSYATFETYTHMDPIIRRIVVWFHDECTFFAYDHRLMVWFLMSAGVKPSKKGEGTSLMVSDFISADYGWLRSPDGKDCAREFFQAGKNREGYFSTAHVCKQVARVVDILSTYYPGEDHVLVFDNAPTHRKRGADAPSAQKMPKYTPGPGSNNFLVRSVDEDGNEIEVPMTGAFFSDGTPQSLYWPEGHPRAGWLKGMAQIMKERGLKDAEKIRAKCPKCDSTRTDCCLRRILFNQPDFANPISILEHLVTSHGHGFLLLPKFHPELNPIEQCWGKAKRTYREFPESKGEAGLKRNVEMALDSVSLEDIRKFCTRSRRICDGYTKGLDGRLSVYAAKRYHGHRVYPRGILEETEKLMQLKGKAVRFKARL